MPPADATGARCEIHIAAAPSRVWELVTDIDLPPRWSPELQRVEWLDGAAAPALGARFAGYNRNPMLGDWRTVSHVVELVPERAFAWLVLDTDGRFGPPATDLADAVATWRFGLSPEAGGTRLRYSVDLGPGRSGLTLAIDRSPHRREEITAFRLNDLRAAIEAVLQGVKTLAETPGGDSRA